MTETSITRQIRPSQVESQRLAIKSLENLIARIGRRQTVNVVRFENARMAVDASPLTTDKFSRFSNILRNAQRYLQLGENGAARYELRQMLRIMQTMGNERQRTRVPHRARIHA